MKIAKAMADRLNSLMSGRLAATPEPQVPATTPSRNPTGHLFDQGVIDAYKTMLSRPGERRAEMRFYDYLENELVDVPKALDAWATMACTGTLTGATQGSFTVRLPEDAPESVRAWMRMYEEVMRIEAPSLVRGMAKYGSYPAEAVLGMRDGRMAVVDYQHIPPATMFRNLDGGDRKYWVQKANELPAVDLERWRVPHFAIWSNVVNAEYTQIYGRSMLQPVGRIGLQLSSCEDALVVARLSRAAMRYLITVDVSDINDSEERIKERVRMGEALFSRQRQLFRGGALDSFQRAPVPDGDFVMPAGKNLAYGVDTLEGDANLGNIKDMEFLLKRYFAALGVPPAYLGQGQDQGGRSSLSQVDIHFARSSRILQLYAAAAFLHGAYAHMILGGFDPDLYPPEIVPPSIGARDELLHAQVRMLQSQVVANLVSAGLSPKDNPRWVLQTLMDMGPELEGLSEQELNSLFKEAPELTQAASSIQRPSSSESAALLHSIRTGTEHFVFNIRSLLAMSARPNELNAYRNHPRIVQIRDGILAA
jgi:hypothetical protein